MFSAVCLLSILLKCFCSKLSRWEGSSSLVECLTWDRGAAGSSLTGVNALCPWARHINPILVLVLPWKIRPYITERLLMGRETVWTQMRLFLGAVWSGSTRSTGLLLSQACPGKSVVRWTDWLDMTITWLGHKTSNHTNHEAHMRAQWLRGRVLDLRPRSCGLEPHQRHCIVVFEQGIFILA